MGVGDFVGLGVIVGDVDVVLQLCFKIGSERIEGEHGYVRVRDITGEYVGVGDFVGLGVIFGDVDVVLQL